jgi:hypothetical protein
MLQSYHAVLGILFIGRRGPTVALVGIRLATLRHPATLRAATFERMQTGAATASTLLGAEVRVDPTHRI